MSSWFDFQMLLILKFNFSLFSFNMNKKIFAYIFYKSINSQAHVQINSVIFLRVKNLLTSTNVISYAGLQILDDDVAQKF